MQLVNFGKLYSCYPNLTIFIVPFKIHHFCHIPLGIINPPKICVNKMSRSLQGTEVWKVRTSVILIHGISEEKHNVRFGHILKAARLNYAKNKV